MTEKRFTQKDEDDWEILDRNKHFAYAHSGYQAEKIIQELNELVETNRELYKENEQLKQFKEKVFVLLDEKIKHYEHKPISAPVGQPMSVNFDADVDRLARLSELQDLEKELKSE